MPPSPGCLGAPWMVGWGSDPPPPPGLGHSITALSPDPLRCGLGPGLRWDGSGEFFALRDAIGRIAEAQGKTMAQVCLARRPPPPWPTAHSQGPGMVVRPPASRKPRSRPSFIPRKVPPGCYEVGQAGGGGTGWGKGEGEGGRGAPRRRVSF